MKIGNKLKELREKSGYTQNQVANYLDVDQTTISKIEKEERNISMGMLIKLANLYGCGIKDFTKSDEHNPIALAFRANNIDLEDMEAIARLKKIVLNIRLMDQIVEERNINDK